MAISDNLPYLSPYELPYLTCCLIPSLCMWIPTVGASQITRHISWVVGTFYFFYYFIFFFLPFNYVSICHLHVKKKERFNQEN